MTARRKRAGLREMADAAATEAGRIRAAQAALVSAGHRDEPSPDMIRRAETFEDLDRLVSAIIPVREQVLKAVAPVLKAARAAAPAGSDNTPDT